MKKADLEIERILALPRRPAIIPSGIEAEMTERLKLPSGTMTLFPIQAWALKEAEERGGLIGAIGVGRGKTAVSALAPSVLRSERSVLLVPGKLKKRFIDKDYPELSKHWRLPPLANRPGEQGLLVASHDDISSQRRANILEAHQPDTVVIDEAHAFRYSVSGGERSARTTRLLRYWQESDAAGCTPRLVALTGTLFQNSLADAGHLTWLALGTGSPLPLDWSQIYLWSLCIDPLPKFGSPTRPFSAPCHRLLLPTGSDDRVTVDSLREAIHSRMAETRGLVSVKETRLGVSLYVHKRDVKLSEPLAKVISKMRTEWISPDGEEITDALVFSRLVRQLSLGFYYRRIWPNGEAPEIQKEYTDALSAWNREVRTTLGRKASQGFDSPGLLEQAAIEGRWKSKSYGRWAAVRDLAAPGRETVWIDTCLVEDASDWAAKNTGIVWVKHQAMGEKMSELSGMALYGDESDVVDVEAEDGSRSIVVSIDKHGTGARLHNFSSNLVTYVSSGATVWEQLLGRTHRHGQTKSVTDVFVYLHTPEAKSAFSTAQEKARFVQTLSKSEQKLNLADYTF